MVRYNVGGNASASPFRIVASPEVQRAVSRSKISSSATGIAAAGRTGLVLRPSRWPSRLCDAHLSSTLSWNIIQLDPSGFNFGSEKVLESFDWLTNDIS